MSLSLTEIREQATSLAIDDLQEALDFLRTELPDDCPVASTILSMIRRLKRSQQNLRKGLIALEDSEIIENQIFDDLLKLLRELDAHKLEKGTEAGTGRILYDIPPKMVVGEEVRCRVRLAFLEEVVRQNLEVTDTMEIHPIRISEVMSVELVDPSAEPVFSIRTISDEIQRIDPDFPSEWWFYVTAIQEGHHALVLRVSLIEQVDGVDRKRNMVLEEVIDIMEMAPKEAPVREFREAPYLVEAGNVVPEEQEDAGSFLDVHMEKKKSVPPTVISPSPLVDIPTEPPRPAPTPSGPSRRRATINRWATYTIVGLAVFTVASYAMIPGVRSELNWWMVKDSKRGYEEYIEEFPESHRASQAIKRLEKIEVEERRRQQEPDLVIPDSITIPTPDRTRPDTRPDDGMLVTGSLAERAVVNRPTYNRRTQQLGQIVVKVCADASGKVVRAEYSQAGSTSANPELRNIAVQAAKKWVFAPSEKELECGTIRFDFTLR